MTIFLTGLGIGLNLIPSCVFSYNAPELYMPLYLNLKGYLPISQNSSLFASFDIGGSFGLTEGVTGLSGLYIAPSVGVSILNKFNVSIGYDLQKLSTGISGVSADVSAVSIRLAYRF